MTDAQLKEFLVEGGMVSARVFDAALAEAAEAGRSVSEILVARYAVDEDDIRRAAARIAGIPFVSLMDEPLPFEALSLIPEPVVRKHHVVAYRVSDNVADVAMLNIDAFSEVESLLREAGVRARPRITDAASIRYALKRYQRALAAHSGERMSRAVRQLADESSDDDPTLSASVRELHDALLHHAAASHASDIHLEPRGDALVARYRVGGALYDGLEVPRAVADRLIQHIREQAEMPPRVHTPHGGRYMASVSGEPRAMRVATMPTEGGERVVLRMAPTGSRGFSLESLGVHPSGVEHIHRAVRDGGMVLIAGPSQSGVTTTLYTLLDILHARHLVVGTIEDQVEYRMPGVHHTQARPQQGFSMAHGVRALMRQDADVIMVGVLNDMDTAMAAIQAALSGRLVVAGIAASTVADALAELESLGVDRDVIASAVSVVTAQRLVRALAGEVDEIQLTRADREQVESIVDPATVLRALRDEAGMAQTPTWSRMPFYRSTQGERGYKGNTAFCEVMPVSRAIKDMLVRGTDVNDVYLQARKEGMLTLPETGVMKAAQGYTTIDEILRVLRE